MLKMTTSLFSDTPISLYALATIVPQHSSTFLSIGTISSPKCSLRPRPIMPPLYLRHWRDIMGTDQRAEVWAKTSGYCWYCGRLMNPWSNFTIDHMDPRIQGGGDNLSNLVPCCKICNSRKGGKTVIEYKEYLANKDEHTFWF